MTISEISFRGISCHPVGKLLIPAVPVRFYQLQYLPQLIHHRIQLRDGLGGQVLWIGQITGLFGLLTVAQKHA
jgi:hypothetical protein